MERSASGHSSPSDSPSPWSVQGQRCLITGANTGIGRVTAIELAKRGARLILAGRSRERHREVMEAVHQHGPEPIFVPLDLASLASVRSAARTVLDAADDLPLLINNAGVAGFRGRTRDGFELAFGVNHLGHHLLTRLLWSLVARDRPGRVIVVASKAHYDAKSLDWSAFRQRTRSLTGVPEYERSKLCNVLFAQALARRVPPSVSVYALHPGVVASDIWRRIPQPFRWYMTRRMISNEEGAQGTLQLATAARIEAPSGTYFNKTVAKEPNPLALDFALQEQLWRRSEAWCGLEDDTGTSVMTG
ncbi:MAG: SDR family NAD(P)-dependent oxidoreductase [Myxococcota bacterium]